MRVKFTTESLSVYEVDTVEKTWIRLSKTEKSGHLRDAENGTFNDIGPIEIGTRVEMMCPPIRGYASARYITTSPVVSVTNVSSN